MTDDPEEINDEFIKPMIQCMLAFGGVLSHLCNNQPDTVDAFLLDSFIENSSDFDDDFSKNVSTLLYQFREGFRLFFPATQGDRLIGSMACTKDNPLF